MANGKTWTEEDDAIIRRMVRAGRTDGEIGNAIGRHPKCVGRRRRALLLQPGQPAALRIVVARLALRRLQLAA